MRPNPLRCERLRILEKPFAWIPFRLITEGHFNNLTDNAKLVYLFLCLVADNKGLSFYGIRRISTYFELTTEQIIIARKELIKKDMIAYDGRLYQVLSLPSFSAQAIPSKPRTTSSNNQPEQLSDILKRLNLV